MELPIGSKNVFIQSDVLTVTKNNVYFGEEVIQNRNICSVGKVVENNTLQIILIVVGLVIALGGLMLVTKTFVPVLLGLILAGVGVFVKAKQGLVITMASGGQRILRSSNGEFIDDLIKVFYAVFESKDVRSPIVIQAEKQQIVVGDNFSNISGSHIISKSSNAGMRVTRG